MNRVILVGNLARDVELRYLPNGGAVSTTSIAVSHKYKKQDGSKGEEVCFIDLTFFGRSAEIANQYLERGKKVLVEGRLKLDQWTDQQGVKRSKHSVVVETMEMLGGKIEEQQQTTYETYDKKENLTEKRTVNRNSDEIPDIDINDDEIQF